MQEIRLNLLLSNGEEISLFYYAGEKSLLVRTSYMGADRTNQVENMLPWAKKLGWSLLLPEFRAKFRQ